MLRFFRLKDHDDTEEARKPSRVTEGLLQSMRKNKQSRLLEAVKEGDLKTIKEMINSDEPAYSYYHAYTPFIHEQHKFTPEELAIRCNHVDIIEYFEKLRIKWKAMNSDTCTILLSNTQYNHSTMQDKIKEEMRACYKGLLKNKEVAPILHYVSYLVNLEVRPYKINLDPRLKHPGELTGNNEINIYIKELGESSDTSHTSSEKQCTRDLEQVVIHEFMHAVMEDIFFNNRLPFLEAESSSAASESSDIDPEEAYRQIIELTRTSELEAVTYDEHSVVIALKEPYMLYPEDQLMSERIARIPEMLVAGYRKALNRLYPKELEYYFDLLDYEIEPILKRYKKYAAKHATCGWIRASCFCFATCFQPTSKKRMLKAESDSDELITNSLILRTILNHAIANHYGSIRINAHAYFDGNKHDLGSLAGLGRFIDANTDSESETTSETTSTSPYFTSESSEENRLIKQIFTDLTTNKFE